MKIQIVRPIGTVTTNPAISISLNFLRNLLHRDFFCISATLILRRLSIGYYRVTDFNNIIAVVSIFINEQRLKQIFPYCWVDIRVCPIPAERGASPAQNQADNFPARSFPESSLSQSPISLINLLLPCIPFP